MARGLLERQEAHAAAQVAALAAKLERAALRRVPPPPPPPLVLSGHAASLTPVLSRTPPRPSPRTNRTRRVPSPRYPHPRGPRPSSGRQPSRPDRPRPPPVSFVRSSALVEKGGHLLAGRGALASAARRARGGAGALGGRAHAGDAGARRRGAPRPLYARALRQPTPSGAGHGRVCVLCAPNGGPTAPARRQVEQERHILIQELIALRAHAERSAP